jgi:hypothetical protein
MKDPSREIYTYTATLALEPDRMVIIPYGVS